MTPYYWSVDRAIQAGLAAIQAGLAELGSLDTDVDGIADASRRTGNDQTSRERPAT